METFTPSTAGHNKQVSSLAWTVIGFEETILGYNQLLERRLFRMVATFVDNLNLLLYNYSRAERGTIRNAWHFSGVEQFAYYYLDYMTDAERLQPLQGYLTYPYCVTDWTTHTTLSEKCEWCQKQFISGCLVMDDLQAAAFCCTEHALAHRQALGRMIPQIANLYTPESMRPFQPLPWQYEAMHAYMQSLPLLPIFNDQGQFMADPDPIDLGQYTPRLEIPRFKKVRNQ